MRTDEQGGMKMDSNNKQCYWCSILQKGDRLTSIQDWGEEIIWDIEYCPKCGKPLKDYDKDDE